MPSNIEWTDETWNPVTGCSRVSPGCDHCYMVETRISTTNDYDGEKAAEAVALMPEFIADAIRLHTAMTGEPWE